jgi:dTDP-4-dehydrorhamnose reductase
MRNKSVLVLGTNGMLGSVVGAYLQHYFTVYKYDSQGFNILKHPLDTLRSILTNDLDYVINCAGIIKPRIKDHTPEEVLKVNSLFPGQLCDYIEELDQEANERDDYYNQAQIIHISSDCVFSGKQGEYTEVSRQDAEDLYGISKALGEMSIQHGGMVLRTSIIGEELKNKYSLLEWARSQKGKKVQGFTDHLWNGVTTLELAKIIYNMIIDDFEEYGIYNIFSETVTKYELLNKINNVYRLNLKVEEVDSGNPINRTLATIRKNDLEYNGDELEPPVYVTKPLEEQLEELKEFCSNGHV